MEMPFIGGVRKLMGVNIPSQIPIDRIRVVDGIVVLNRPLHVETGMGCLTDTVIKQQLQQRRCSYIIEFSPRERFQSLEFTPKIEQLVTVNRSPS